jgi:hypothetical protein
MVALADVFDALVRERPYKPAWPLEQAVMLDPIGTPPDLVSVG